MTNSAYLKFAPADLFSNGDAKQKYPQANQIRLKELALRNSRSAIYEG